MLARPAPRQRGFSLVEAAVTMAVLGIAMAIAVPEAATWIKGLKVRNTAESMRGGMERARMEALKTNGNVGFWVVSDASAKVPTNSCALSSSAAAWVVSGTSPAGACGAAPSLTAGPRLVMRSGAAENTSSVSVSALDAAGAAATQVIFNGLGQVVAGAGTIQTVDVTAADATGRRLRVVVEPGGAVRMCDRDVAADDPRVCPAL